jgi:GNAT superfamily N-acetyltransferase
MIHLRPASPDDATLLLAFIRELAEYERAPDAVTAVEADLLRDGFGPEPRFRAIVAEVEGEPAGFALFFFSYSTWQGRKGLYLEDLFVRPRFRGRGVGKALFVHLARLAVDEGCGRFQWQVLDWNQPSIEFYEAMGARRMTEWLTMRLEGDALARLGPR